ncbi:papain-like cysteine protease family protein [Aliikangiella coralliicola]|nr:papain-like cysteine protease family protein [Aliikangiella coralliicola]
MPQIRANRDSIDDRFSVLGFNIQTESPLFEVGVTTDPALFHPQNRNQRNRNNFYSSRAVGAIRAPRGEAVYLLPPHVLSNFIGKQRLYFGLATYSDNSHGKPDFVQTPSNGSMYVSISGLSGRGLQRVVNNFTPPGYVNNVANGNPSLEWGGDALPAAANDSNVATTPTVGNNGQATDTNGQASPPLDYDDGFGPLPVVEETNNGAADQANGSQNNGQTNGPQTNRPQTNGQSPDGQPIDNSASNPAQNTLTQPGATPDNGTDGDRANNGHSQPLQPGATSQPLELIRPFYDPSDPSSALMSQNNAFSLEREEWFAGVPNTQMFPHSAICQLLMRTSDGRLFQGTGFYIGSNRILTCAHNLANKASVTIIPARNGSSNKPYSETTVTSSSWRIAPNYSGSGDWANDLAVIDNVPIAAPNGQYFKFLHMTPSTQMPIVVCGYSAGSRVVPELNEIIDPDMQHLHGGYVDSQSSPETIEYPILTLMGASGSPVYHLSDESGQLEALIAAVHVNSEQAANGLNGGCFITPDKIDWIEGRTTSFALAKGLDCDYHNRNQQQNGHSRAMAIPLDPGEGGMSISIEALSPGDIIVSTARHIVSYVIRLGTLSAVSHAMLYVGDGKVIEAVGDGVREVGLEQALNGALIAVAYRDPRVNSAIANQIVNYAKTRIGNPYNYAGVAYVGYSILNPGKSMLINAIADRLGLRIGQAGATYCSELVFDAYEQASVPLGVRPSTSTPDDIVDLFGDRLDYVGHLLAEDVPLGIALSRTASHSRALNSSFAIHWQGVPFQPQSSVASCWAACAAMVVGWRDQMSIADSDIAAKVPVIDAYKNGLWPRQRQALADTWNLVAEPPASYSINSWRQLLQSNGPLYVDMNFSPNSGGHARVLVGMESDGAADGSDTRMFMYDPWPGTKGKITLSFADFLSLYEGRTDNSGGHLEYQILHSGQIPQGLQPGTASAFSAKPVAGHEQSDVPPNGQTNGPNADYTPALIPSPEAVTQQPTNGELAHSMEGATVAIASVVAGAVMERLVNNEGDITWELDQLRGFKHPNDTAPSPVPPAHDGTVIRLTDWPYIENYLTDQISAGFEVNWQYNGKSLGNILISNVATNDAVGWGLTVKAKIMDDNIVYPRNAPEFAALRVRFEYRFTRTIGSDKIAIRDLHLFANGRYNLTGRWEQ